MGWNCCGARDANGFDQCSKHGRFGPEIVFVVLDLACFLTENPCVVLKSSINLKWRPDPKFEYENKIWSALI